VLEADGIKNKIMKKNVRKECIRGVKKMLKSKLNSRNKKMLKSKLNSRNIITAINSRVF